jgi:phosphocarrier protein FPr
MVGLVLVSHSRPLADALVGLIRQFAPPELRIAVAAGIGADRGGFGTDAVEIAGAIQSVCADDGVLVLMDLGSAVLSAELALEFLPDEIRENTLLCPAPLLEGGIAAAVQAGAGSDLRTVADEARQALQAKQDHFAAGAGASTARQVSAPVGKSIEVTLVNVHGLHARPAAWLVREAAAYDAEVWVANASNGKGPVTARSLNGLATLGAVKGHRLTITASGSQAYQVLQSLKALVQSGFGETGVEEDFSVGLDKTLPRPAEGTIFQGIPVSEGVALGPLYIHHPPPPVVSDFPAQNPEVELGRLEQALQQARLIIQERRFRLAAALGEAKAAILDAHLLILQDPDLLAIARQRIFEDEMNAAAAWQLALREIQGRYEALDDAYQRGRAADVLDAGSQVLFSLVGQPALQEILLPGAVILAARELSIGEISRLETSKVLGVVTSSGGRTSHSAILYRSMGLPAVSGIDISSLQPGALAALDGTLGCVWIEPDADEQSRLEKIRERWLEERKLLIESSRLPVVLPSGRRIEVAANVGSLADARAARLNGADGVGVLRTELLYLNRLAPPSEAEQIEILSQICQDVGGGAMIVRTLDIGGDKYLPYLPLPVESNPYLGVRAIRLSKLHPEMFLTQLRAILRVGAVRSLRVMFPMVTSLDEILWARDQLEAAHQALRREELPHAYPVETGIMIEVPSAALLSDVLAPHVDFFSVGTNDLTQYTLAAERGNTRLVDYGDALHPGVLRQIKMTVEAAHHHGKWVGVCGEVAADPLAAVLLVGLGVDELSMNSAEIPRVKAALRGMDEVQAGNLAQQALGCASAAEVRSLAGGIFLGLDSK